MNYLEQIKKDPKLVWDYIQGSVRTKMFFNIPYLLRNHIKEQFEWRSTKAVACLVNGSCLSCGCDTPDLFMSNKACSLSKLSSAIRVELVGDDKVCYPKMKNKINWLKFKNNNYELE
jgi:hypothetical protein